MERRLEESLAQLVIKNRFARRKIRYGPRTGALVLQLESADDAVRSWPEEFHRKYSGVLPVNEPAETPEEEAGRGAPGRQGADELAVFADELLDIAQGCGYDGRPAYRLPIVFPRFAAAFAALVAWQPIGARTTRAEHDALLERWVKRAIAEARSHILQELRRRLRGLPSDSFIAGKMGGLAGFTLRMIGRLRFPYLRTLLWYRKKGLGGRAPRTTRMLVKDLRRWRELPVERREPSGPGGRTDGSRSGAVRQAGGGRRGTQSGGHRRTTVSCRRPRPSRNGARLRPHPAPRHPKTLGPRPMTWAGRSARMA